MKKNIDAAFLVEELISYAKLHLKMRLEDENYIRNQLISILKIEMPTDKRPSEISISQMLTPDRIIRDIVDYALSEQLLCEGQENLFDSLIMGIVTPMPSVVADTFECIKQTQGAAQACEYLFDLSIKNNYIHITEVQKNIKWVSDSKKANLEISINLSKPEKDNKEIERLRSLPQLDYPKCVLCLENTGYAGRSNHPARQTLRTIPVLLANEKWHMQFSPYAYYNEHCIVFSESHTPMVINATTFQKLADFVDQFPHYFIGSNACLPIVGGSILTHEHFQGGHHVMPIHKAKKLFTFTSEKFPTCEFSILDWYTSTVHIESCNKEEIIRAGTSVQSKWQDHSDTKNEIIAKTKNTQHNAVTPIMRRDGDMYILDIVLRNNRTSEQHPSGIFHSHEEFHSIKKEGIGIIEVMGLFILPARLKSEIDGIKEYITGVKKFTPKVTSNEEHPLKIHFPLIRDIIKKYSNELSLDDSDIVVKEFINIICEKILECTAVFKDTEQGIEGFKQFVKLII